MDMGPYIGSLHVIVLGAVGSVGGQPGDVLVGVFDVSGFAVDAI